MKATTKKTTSRKTRTKTPDWNALDARTKLAVTRKIIKALNGARYKIVTGTDQLQREGGITERHGEDEILNTYGRGKLLDLARNATRNSSTFNGILK